MRRGCRRPAGNQRRENAQTTDHARNSNATDDATRNMAYAAATIPTGRRSVALDNDTRQNVVIRPMRTTRASARTSKLTGRRKCVVRSIGLIGR